MVTIDSSFAPPGDVQTQTTYTGPIVLFALLGSVLIAAASLVLDAEGGYGWSSAAEMVSRFSLLLFVAAMTVEPLSRLFPVPAMRVAGRERGSLILAFAMASMVSLACVLAPSQLGSEKMALPAFVYSAMTGGILVVMLFSAHPATKRVLGGPTWRTMQRIATMYFWLVFALTSLDHVVGPGQSDSWWGISLLLLTGAILVRFADALLYKLRKAPVAGNVV